VQGISGGAPTHAEHEHSGETEMNDRTFPDVSEELKGLHNSQGVNTHPEGR